MIFTTNKRLKDWGRVVHDKDLAAAIVDRILERGRLLSLDGPSMRTRHVALDDPIAADAFTEPAIISGIDRQDFPESTTSLAALPVDDQSQIGNQCDMVEGFCGTPAGIAGGETIVLELGANAG